MSGLRRTELLNLDYIELSEKLKESGLPEEAVSALRKNKIDGNTLTLLERDDVETEFRDEGIAVRIHIRGLLRKLDSAENASVNNNLDISLSQIPQNSQTGSTKTSSIISSGSQTTPSTVSLFSGDSEANSSMGSQPFTPSTTRRLDTVLKKYSPGEEPSTAIHSTSSKIPKDLPANFKLPNQFGKAIDQQIQKSKTPGSLSKEMRNRLIRQVETTVSSYNSSPASSTVEWLAKGLCEKYPCLQQVDPRSGMADTQNHAENDTQFKSWILLKKQLLKRFENSRSQNKKLESCDEPPEPSRKKLKLSGKKGSSAHAESDEELQKHDAFLQKEMKKSKPNREVVTQLMDKVFPMTRDFITKLDAKCRIKETLKKYPCLEWLWELQNEMIRILAKKFQGSDSVANTSIDQMKQKWNTQAQRLKAFGRYKCFFDNLLTDDDDDSDDNETQDYDSGDEHRIASISDFELLQVLPSMFPDGKMLNKNFFLQEAGQGDPCPQLKGRTTPYLLIYELKDEQKRQVFIMDGKQKYLELEKPARAADAILSLLALYYVYNFQYPTEAKGVYTFLQEFILSDLVTFKKHTTRYMTSVNEYLSYVNINF